ncbi:molybdate transport system permease protein [Bacillus mesophilus]|uniref:Molybdenum transport system permease n=1 Tax=Bacillus mesophilus TaxID=1808955 RepID=A0A6M0Q3S1_9BACI|nr:molybdate ABC transporter permease subunit [Bacillus mesophilus]MBM7659993.1 molybdate transport system permease protein [Bacillus mesophilus]NEY70854.1 molybdate ABC transporter permease subunit [Bacillus mesophilus]
MTMEFIEPIKLSIQVAIIASLLVLVFGIIAGKLMARNRFRGKMVFETILLLPLVLPPSVVGFILLLSLGANSPVGRWIHWIFDQPIIFTWWAAVIASTVVAFPLMYQAVKIGFEEVDGEVEDAARVDGASERRVFFTITMPLAKRAVISGAILSFARALGEFGATLMVAGNIPGKTQTIPTAIYIAMDTGNLGLAWSWVIVMIVISFIMLAIVYKLRGN